MLITGSILSRGDLMGYWTMGDLSSGAWVALWLLRIATFAIGSFIFSVIFWATKEWLEKGNIIYTKTKKKR